MQFQRKDRTIRIPLGATIVTFFAATAALLYFYVAGTIDRNHQRFDLEVDGISRILSADGDLGLVRIKDMVAMLATDQRYLIEQKLFQLSKRSPNVVEIGYFSVGGRFRHERFVGDRGELRIDSGEAEALNSELKRYPSRTRGFTADRYPKSFSALRSTDLVLVQSAPDRENPGKDLIVYLVLDLDAAIAKAFASFATSTRLSGLQLRVGDTLYDWKSKIGNEDSGILGVSKHSRKTVTIVRDVELIVDFAEQRSDVPGLFGFVVGLVFLFLLATALFVMFARCGRLQQQRLQDALQRANAANEAKGEFLANVSHEIRTPLNGILGMADVLIRTELSALQKTYLQLIATSGSLLLTILNDVLDMAKLESGQIAINPTRVDLPVHMKEIVSFYFAQAREKKLELVLDLAPQVPRYIEVDPMRLRQVLGNLISNAIKFTPSGSIAIVVSYRPADDAEGVIEVAVTDTGIGLSVEQQKKLFRRFAQASEDDQGHYEGTGLGLAICKKLCDAMGGDITVDSNVGVGSTFKFWLPVSRLPSDSMPINSCQRIAVITGSDAQFKAILNALSDEGSECIKLDYGPELPSKVAYLLQEGPLRALIFDQDRDLHRACDQWLQLKRQIPRGIPAVVLGEREVSAKYEQFDAFLVKPFIGADLIECLQSVAVQEKLPTAVARPPSINNDRPDWLKFEGLHALLVDDNQINLIILEEIMRQFCFDVESTTEGATSIELAKKGSFDLILMDCQMPEMNGFVATGRLRELMAQGLVRECPIVAVTANALKGDREACIEAGMDDVVFKPISVRSMSEILSELLKRGLLKLPQETRSPAAEPNGVVKVIPPATVASVAGAAATSSGDAIGREAAAIDPARTDTLGADNDTQNATTSAALLRPPETVPSPVADAAPRADSRSKIPLMDFSVLRQTRDLVRNFDTLLSLYRTDTRAYLDLLRERIDTQEWESAVLPAHTIKSSSRIIGASGMAALAERLENLLRSGEAGPADLRAILVRMENIFEHTLRQLDVLEANGSLRSATARAS
ncbi:putative sensor protein [Bradyrhizobium sp. ORS 285]|uniref:hybrid sensor histidine kinase/response regulator n=1 Tax=Bradyrhizobium sp. ORS 285 TaxID=115808 RepID=UPI0002406DA2|nr:hybrid sensor histidine kinase/response regulator [Bradyrhizobium sp. ORS 285]CCD87875.1 putative sensor protein [Bradyrhizobium sp. ORS 285]SMX61039.1 putative sensor protein [Bradyrhizobium sp. ORS 285]